MDEFKLTGILRYNESLRFYAVAEDGRKFVCSDYEQTICTKNELLKPIRFHVNENDDATDIEVLS